MVLIQAIIDGILVGTTYALIGIGFTLVFAVPAQMPLSAWLSAHSGLPNAMCWSPLVFLFVLLPACDYLLGHDPANVPADAERAIALNPWFRALTLLARPVQLAPQVIPADYIRVHEQYSPTAQIQGVAPYLNAATVPGPAPRQ